ncbi:unnamed protein product [Hymenolepis diminuta]|uniref:THAP-type domain-containing protein n=2 Tax=Hymenolepis diminuta TaxID=6216 RepID=A0A0R3SSY4_HYMDI|nr:unnamed protein product [Hymenolepis diminuta]
MPTTCGFPNCKFRSRYKGFEDNRHFYRVPKKPAALRAKWLEAIGRTEANIVSQLRICSGHFHGGEKREGDIPVADPAIDPPKRIELPSKNQRLSVSSSSPFVRHYHRGGSSNVPRFRGRGRGGLSLKLIPPRFLSTLPPPTSLTPPQTLLTMESSILDLNQDTLMMNVWNMLMNGPPYLPPLSTILQTIPQNTMLPSATTTAQPVNSPCVRSSTLVIFDRFPVQLSEIPEMKCCKSVVKNVVVIQKLDEFWLTSEVCCTTRISYKVMLPQPDVDIAADLVFSKILQVNYKNTFIQAHRSDYTCRTDSVHFTKNLREKIIGIIGLEASLICSTNRVHFDYLALARSLNQGNIKSVVLAKEHIANLLPLHTSISEDTRSSPNIQEINPAKLLTKESLNTHRQNVSEFVSRFLNDMVKQSISQPTGKQKITSGENQCPIHSTKSDVIIKKQIKIDQGGSMSKGKEPKNLHYNRMSFSIDTLVKSGKDSENLS